MWKSAFVAYRMGVGILNSLVTKFLYFSNLLGGYDGLELKHLEMSDRTLQPESFHSCQSTQSDGKIFPIHCSNIEEGRQQSTGNQTIALLIMGCTYQTKTKPFNSEPKTH